MSEAFFYHMTETPLEVTLPMLLEKSLAAGWRVAVRGQDPARLDLLDGQLWNGPGFLPHGRAGGPHDADQPVLLTHEATAANDPTCLISVDGAPIDASEVAAMTRTMVLFDGNAPDAVQVARDQWKALTGAGVIAKYWSQEGGGWSLKAERKGAGA